MIGKAPGTGSGFRGVVNYLMLGKKESPNPDRVAWAETRNLFVDDLDLAPRAMRATAAQSTRCKKPAYHFVISWRQDENPTADLMRLVADTTLGDLDLADHQAVLIAHHDTDHKHLHVVVNRIHPETTKAWHTGKDWERLEVSLGRQALEHGLLFVPGRHNCPDKLRPTPKRARDGDLQMAKRKGDPIPPLRWSVEEIHSRRTQLGPIIDGARSWDQLALRLKEDGLTVHAKGQGVVIADTTGHMKLSDLSKNVRLKALEELYAEPFATFDTRRQREAELAADHSAPSPEALSPTSDVIRNDRAFERPRTRARMDVTKLRQIAKEESRTEHPPQDFDTEPTSEATAEKERERLRAEEEKQRLREEMRERRIAEREQELAARTAMRKPDDWQDDDSATETTVQRATSAAASADKAPLSAREHAEHALKDALTSLDFAYGLHNLGIISSSELLKAKADRDHADAELNKHLTFKEYVENSVSDAFRPSPKPPHKDNPDRAYPEKKDRPPPSRDDDDDRDR